MPGGWYGSFELVGDDCYEPPRAAFAQQQQHIAALVRNLFMADMIPSNPHRSDGFVHDVRVHGCKSQKELVVIAGRHAIQVKQVRVPPSALCPVRRICSDPAFPVDV